MGTLIWTFLPTTHHTFNALQRTTGLSACTACCAWRLREHRGDAEAQNSSQASKAMFVWFRTTLGAARVSHSPTSPCCAGI